MPPIQFPVFAPCMPGEEVDIHAAELDLEPAISAITERAQHLTGATGAAIALRAGDEIVCRARAGRTAPDLGVRLQTDAGISAEAVRTGEVMLCHDAERNPRVDLASCRRLGRPLHSGFSAALLSPHSRRLRSAVVFSQRLRRTRRRHHATAFQHDGRRHLPHLQPASIATRS